MSRRKRPDWSEVKVHLPKRVRGFYCAGEWYTRRENHYVYTGEVHRCDRCWGTTWVCHEHWEMHTNEHMLRELADRGRKNG